MIKVNLNLFCIFYLSEARRQAEREKEIKLLYLSINLIKKSLFYLLLTSNFSNRRWAIVRDLIRSPVIQNFSQKAVVLLTKYHCCIVIHKTIQYHCHLISFYTHNKSLEVDLNYSACVILSVCWSFDQQGAPFTTKFKQSLPAWPSHQTRVLYLLHISNHWSIPPLLSSLIPPFLLLFYFLFSQIYTHFLSQGAMFPQIQNCFLFNLKGLCWRFHLTLTTRLK